MLWFYDEMGNFAIVIRGVRQGCVLRTTILCITIKPAYDALHDLLDLEGFPFSYADEIYMGGKPANVS